VLVRSTGGYGNYIRKTLGTINLQEAGSHTLQISPEADRWQPINLRRLELKLK
jgi:alpha-L-fucosidase